MNSNIPSVRASIRELWFAAGGCAACVSACALIGGVACDADMEAVAALPPRPSKPGGWTNLDSRCRDGSSKRCRLLLENDVLDGQVRRLVEAVNQVAAQPRRLRRREGRDDDLVGALVLDRVGRRRERVRVRNLAV